MRKKVNCQTNERFLRMRVRPWIVLSIIVFSITNCNKADNTRRTKANNAHDSIPRYDSVDWAKQHHFEPIDKADRADKYRFLDQFYHDFWLHNKVSGGFLVAQHGKIIYEGYSGYSDFENQTPITSETPIHIASISKVLTGLAILKLVEFEKIDLEEKVNHYLTGFPYEEVTVEDLLNHRSGLPNYLHFSDDKKYWDNSNMITNQDVLNILINKKPEVAGPPSKSFSYNNTNFVLLALIIEKVTGLSYPIAMDYMVFRPLGMKNTFVMQFDKDSATVSKSYYNNGREWKYDFLDATYGDKNIYATPRDLFKMDVAMYSTKFLPKNLKKKAWQGYSYEAKGVKNYGLGIRMMEWDDGAKILYHNGWWHGNYTTYVRDFENEATIIALGNRKNRTVYSSFRLVSLFGEYPLAFPETSDSAAGDGQDSLRQLQNEIDSAKKSDRNKKTSRQQEKGDSSENRKSRFKKLDFPKIDSTRNQ